MTAKKQRSYAAVAFGAVFASFGIFFFLVAGWMFADAATVRGWTRVPATIGALEVTYPSSKPKSSYKHDVYELRGTFSYELDGEQRQSTTLRRSPITGITYHKLALQIHDLIRKEHDHAYVNPDDPKEAVLLRESLASGLFLLFPIPFVLIGLAIAAGGMGWFPKSIRPAEYKSSTDGPKGCSSCFLVVFGLAFTAAGAGAAWGLFLGPWLHQRDAGDWIETPCQVIWSRVRSHQGDESTSYSVEVLYEYEFDGETHRSNRYSFVGGSSSGRKAKSEAVRKFPRGLKTQCFVNPETPELAVLTRDLKLLGWWVLFPIPFLAIGLGTLFFGSRLFATGKTKNKSSGDWQRDKDQSLTSLSKRESAPNSDSSSQERQLSSRGKRIGSFVGTLLIAAFWNGITLAVSSQFLKDGFQGGWWILTLLFFVPFWLVGMLLLAATVHTLGGLFNPQAKIRISPGEPYTNDKLQLGWKLSGGISRVRNLRITLEGVEEAHYVRGTDHRIDKEMFFCKILVDESRPLHIHEGTAEFEIPAGAMPTLELIDNKIRWFLIVKGNIPLWPDIHDSHEIKVRPFTEKIKR